MQKIVIIGAGGHAKSLASLIYSLNLQVVAFVDINAVEGSFWGGTPIYKSICQLPECDDYSFAIGVGSNAIRKRMMQEVMEFYESPNFPTLIHPTAVISKSVEIGIGTQVMAMGYVGPCSKIGNFCILNTRSIAEHDTKIGDFSFLGPSATLGGGVRVGDGVSIFMGACVRDSVVIDDYSTLGANSYLHKNLESGVFAWGSPAKIMKRLKNG